MTTPLEPKLIADNDQWTLVVERTLDHSPERVWKALTEPGQLVKWAPFQPDQELTSPGTVRLTMLGVEKPDVQDSQVHVIEPPTLLILEWGKDILRWELSGESSTRLVLKHQFVDVDQAPSYAAGWHLCLASLATTLNGEDAPSVAGENALNHSWQDWYDYYAKKLLPVS